MTSTSNNSKIRASTLFYGLILVSLLLSVLISMNVIGSRTESSIKDYQSKTTEIQSKLYLDNITHLLETNIQLVSDLSRTPEFANTVMGSDVSMVALHDRFDDFLLLGKKEKIRLVNIIGEVIYSNHTDSSQAAIDEPWLLDVITDQAPFTVSTFIENNSTKLRVTYPVKYYNLTEGALIVEFQQELNNYFIPENSSLAAIQGITLSGKHTYFSTINSQDTFLSITTQPVSNTGLNLEFFIDIDAISRDTAAIQRDLALSIIASLLISFVILSLIGVRYLLNPFKQLEKANENNKLFAAAIESSPIGITIADATKPDNPLIFVNQAFEQMTGYSQDEVLNRGIDFLHGNLTSKEIISKIIEATENNQSITTEIINYKKNRTPFWNQLIVSPVLDSTGKSAYFVGVQKDVTDEKNQQNYIDGITKASPACLSYIDRNGRYQFVNETYTRWNNKPSDYYIGKTVQEVFGEETYASFASNMKDAFEGKISTYETIYPKPDGTERYVRGSFIPDSDDYGNVKGFFVTVEDISAFKETEKEQQKAREAAEEANRAKSEFLASMSHEIRTPLNGVMGMLDLLQNSELNDIQMKRTKLARSSSEALMTIINDILDFSKIDAGKMELESVSFDIINLLADYSSTAATQMSQNNSELTLDTQHIKHRKIIADPVRIQQIITNITGNAIKFTQDGTILIRASVKETEQGAKFTCEITDTGIGIPTDKLASLFDSFSQVDASTTRKYGGTGLGLTIVRRLCDLMGGHITVKSKVDHGSSFCFEIPVGLSTKQSSMVSGYDLSGKTVLVVDDNPLNLEVIANQLMDWGAEVTTAETADHAKKLINNSEFDCAFIDHSISENSGIKLAKSISALSLTNEIKLVLMSSIDQNETIDEYVSMGFDSYCMKPISVNSLADCCNSIFAKLSEESPAIKQKLPESTGRNQFNDIDHAPILLAEDNKVNQLVAKGILKNMGFHNIDLVENGLEAIAHLANTEISPLILMDCQMPEMDGYEATRKIRLGEAGAQHQNAIVIALTANAMAGDRDKCLEAGMNDYVTKPISSDLLLEKLKKYIQEI